MSVGSSAILELRFGPDNCHSAPEVPTVPEIKTVTAFPKYKGSREFHPPAGIPAYGRIRYSKADTFPGSLYLRVKGEWKKPAGDPWERVSRQLVRFQTHLVRIQNLPPYLEV